MEIKISNFHGLQFDHDDSTVEFEIIASHCNYSESRTARITEFDEIPQILFTFNIPIGSNQLSNPIIVAMFKKTLHGNAKTLGYCAIDIEPLIAEESNKIGRAHV